MAVPHVGHMRMTSLMGIMLYITWDVCKDIVYIIINKTKHKLKQKPYVSLCWGVPGVRNCVSKMNQTCTPKHNLQDLHHQNEACSTDTLPKTNVAPENRPPQ